MLRVKSFPLEKTDEANAFMEDHMPHSTDKMSGIQINMGHLVIFYEDGILNQKHLAQKFQSLISKEQEEIVYSKDKLMRLRKVIKKTVPKGYKETSTDEEVLALCMEEGDSKQDAKRRVEGITLQENDLKMQVAHVMECEDNIQMFEESMKLYANND